MELKLKQTLNSDTEYNEIEKLWETITELIAKVAENIFGLRKRAKTGFGEEYRNQLGKRVSKEDRWYNYIKMKVERSTQTAGNKPEPDKSMKANRSKPGSR